MIELHKKGTGLRILRKVSSIEHVLELDNGCAVVDGEDVQESYDEVKKLLEDRHDSES